MGDIKANIQLEELLNNIRQAFLTDGIDLSFRLFKGEQRAIGEIMIAENDKRDSECIGFAEFVIKLKEKEFSNWFVNLKKSITLLSNEPNRGHEERLITLQHSLVELIDFLDPKCIRISKTYREKISFVRNINA